MERVRSAYFFAADLMRGAQAAVVEKCCAVLYGRMSEMLARLVRKGFINTTHRVEFGMMTPRFITIKGIDVKELTQ